MRRAKENSLALIFRVAISVRRWRAGLVRGIEDPASRRPRRRHAVDVLSSVYSRAAMLGRRCTEGDPERGVLLPVTNA